MTGEQFKRELRNTTSRFDEIGKVLQIGKGISNIYNRDTV